MKLSKKLQLVSEWLASTENDLLVSAENDDKCLVIMAQALVNAADALKEGVEEIKKIEPESSVSPEQLDELAALASAFDESGDEMLQKQASVLDELLLTLAAPGGAILAAKQAEDDRIEQLKKKYEETKKYQDELNKVSDSVKDIEKSEAYKAPRVLQMPLSTRVCIDHPGAQLARVGENRYQCLLDHKIYDYSQGYTTLSGIKVPGSGVEHQTDVMQHTQGDVVFDSRQSRTGQDT